MNNQWASCKNILCIRPDNMGDLLMSSPAIDAIKETFNAKITVLVSSMAKDIIKHIPCIDDTIVYDLPWIKKSGISKNKEFINIIEEIKNRKFDAAIIFTVYSQNPLPSVMLAYLAGIPLRLSYCRENPYELLTDWVPDKEPFTYILHQVKRDLALVAAIGAYTKNTNLQLIVPHLEWAMLKEKLLRLHIDLTEQFIIIHAGVSEFKREYDKTNWVIAAKKIINKTGCQVLFTGSKSEFELTDWLAKETGKDAFSLGGILSLTEFLLLIKHVPLVISVNTVTIHIAAALNIPVIVLYAFTNPQHFPWQATGTVLAYDIPKLNRSKNEIIKYVADNIHPHLPSEIAPESIVNAAYDILVNKTANMIFEMPVLKYD